MRSVLVVLLCLGACAQAIAQEVTVSSSDRASSCSAAYLALWWVPKGHIPGIDEAKKRLAHLEEHGPSPFAFTFKQPFPADEAFLRSIDWGSFKPCPTA